MALLAAAVTNHFCQGYQPFLSIIPFLQVLDLEAGGFGETDLTALVVFRENDADVTGAFPDLDIPLEHGLPQGSVVVDQDAAMAQAVGRLVTVEPGRPVRPVGRGGESGKGSAQSKEEQQGDQSFHCDIVWNKYM